MRPPIPVRQDFRSWTEEKLRNMDTDQFHHINNSAMASFFEAGRMEVFSAPDVRQVIGSASLAVVRLLINFHRELFYPRKVAVGSSVMRVGERSFEFCQGLFDGEDCVASAEVVCVLLDSSTGRAQPIGEPLRNRLLSGRAVR
jgi:acyl-CoA thioester hydrolase